MSRVFLAWELGGGAGHLSHLAIIGDALRKRGHELVFAVRDLAAASRFPSIAGSPMMQAPVWQQKSRLPPSLNYAELLNRVGYLDVAGLAAHVSAWRMLLRMAEPELMIAEHSPTALIAARLEGVRRAALGTGFEIPPRACPMPGIQSWRNAPVARLAEAEEAVLERINRVIAAHRGRPLEALSDMFDLDDRFLATYPEFDHYADRQGAEYRGPLSVSRNTEKVPWPEGEGRRLFVYYRAGYPQFGTLMRQIAGLGLPTLVVADDASPAVIRKYSTDRLKIVTGRVDLEAVAGTADAAVCHGGHGTTLRLVSAGCPLAMLPVVVEQAQMAHRMTAAGVGLMIAPAGAAGQESDFAGMIRRVLEEPDFTARARELAARHAGSDPVAAVEKIADRCEEIIIKN